MSCGCGSGVLPNWFGTNIWRCGRCGEDCLAVRPQGPDGDQGPAGITPAFEVGEVTAGGAPSVTITAVSPTLYRLDFILPETYTAGDNIWTGSNTFVGDVIVSGSTLEAQGGLTTAFLIVTQGGTFNAGMIVNGALTMTATSTFSVAGSSVFTGPVVMQGDTVINDLTVNGLLTINGDVNFNFPALGATQARGRLVVDECDVLKYLEGSGLTTPDTQSDTTPTTVTPGDPETQLGSPIVISIPTFACAPNDVQLVDVMVRVGVVYTAAALGTWAVNLWGGSIGGNLIDTVQIGGGCGQVLLRQINLSVTPGTPLSLFVSAVDGSDPPDSNLVANSVTAWIK